MIGKVRIAMLLLARFKDVVSSAAKNERSNWHKAVTEARRHFSDNADVKFRDFRRKAIYRYAQRNKFTLVEHPVGMHRDFFAKVNDKLDGAALENKLLFSSKRLFSTRGFGRGGKQKSFVFGLLDW